MRKLNVNALVKPGVFWPAMIVLSLAVVFLFFIAGTEKKIRKNTQTQLGAVTLAKETLESQLLGLCRLRDTLKQQLDAQRETVAKLTETMSQKDSEIKTIAQKLDKAVEERQETETQLVALMQEKRILEARIAKSETGAAPVELEKVVVKTQAALKGKVLTVNKEQKFVVVGIGKQNNLNLGDILSIYRGEEFIGRVQIEKMEEKIAAAAILPEWENADFQKDDEAIKI